MFVADDVLLLEVSFFGTTTGMSFFNECFALEEDFAFFATTLPVPPGAAAAAARFALTALMPILLS